MAPHELPEGTVTFLFTDIEGSTRLVPNLGDEWPRVLDAHSSILRAAIDAHQGIALKTEGDSFFAVFREPAQAVLAAADAQRTVETSAWPAPLRVRMGVHSGKGVLGGADYVGIDVHRASRIADTAHGGQLVASERAALDVDNLLPDGLKVRDLGKYRLRDLSDPETIFQIDILGLQRDFPTLRTLDVIPNNLPGQLVQLTGVANGPDQPSKYGRIRGVTIATSSSTSADASGSNSIT